MPKQDLKRSDFVHLHNHSQYSLLDGLTKIPALVQAVKEMGMPSVAVTDHGTLSGVIEFYKEAKAIGIKPIIGIETYVARRDHTDKDPAKDKNPYHLTLLAMNNQGYQNLLRLSTIANLEGYYYRPRIDHKLLDKYNEGLIVLSGCIGGEIGDFLRQDQYAEAKKIASWYKKVFGPRYYLEIADHGHPKHPGHWPEQAKVNEQTIKLAHELNLPCVVTCDAHYLKHEDQEAHEILLCVQTGSFLSDENRMSLKDFELHVTEPKQIINRWQAEHPDFVTNSKKIAELCNVELELGKILIPKFPLPRGETEKSYLRKLVYKGLAWRYGGKTEKEAKALDEDGAKKVLPIDIVARAEYELSVISEMQFNGYFLIIADFVNWGKDRGIVFGPGRGSAAGSIISYALKTTELDPLKYDLLFERFLNPDRISMPDIDIDIQDSRRDEVIKYCIEKYGEGRVANIVTFGRMAARNAVRDVARVLQVPYADADRLAKMIPPPIQGRHIPLKKSLIENAELKDEYRNNKDAKRVFDLAMQLEGTIRSHGVHAAGVVIAPDDIVKFTPLEMAQKGVIATQYSMGPIEDIGLLKMDFLGLSNLTIIKNALRIIKKVYKQELDINTIPLDDKATYELLQRGDTTGVFQLESAGMKRYLKELRPTVFDDIIAMVALYRPGPMQWIEDFIARKHGEREISFIHEAMRPALESTYGVIVYQEQVMQISKEMCSFSGGQADTLRKAIAKKDPAVLAKLRTDFIEGAIKKVGADRQLMERFWSQLEDFAAYCFNKSHAACYGLIAYQTGYLKTHYPDAFMAALMTSDFDNTDRLAIEINECEHMGIKVLPPDINESFVEFAVVPQANSIRFGMAAIKNVGTAAVEEIIVAREKLGGFKTLEAFLTSSNLRIINRKTLESLIKSGALDSFGRRDQLLGNLDNLTAFASRAQKQKNDSQTSMFEDNAMAKGVTSSLTLDKSVPEISPTEQLQWERDLLGIYLSEHPLKRFGDYLSDHTKPISSIVNGAEGTQVTIGGFVSSSRDITTKNGQKMAFVQLVDQTGEIEAVLFPRAYEATTDLWQRDKVLVVKGKLSYRGQNGNNGEAKIIVDEAREVSEDSVKQSDKAHKPSRGNAAPKIYVRLKSSQEQDKLMAIKKVIDENDGGTEVILVMGQNGDHQAIRLPLKISSSRKVVDSLAEIAGQGNVKLN